MAGTVDLVQRCYTGVETHNGILWFDPYLPDDLKEMRFSIQYQRHWLDIRLIRDRIFISARYHAAAPINIGFNQNIHELGPGETLEFELLQPQPVSA